LRPHVARAYRRVEWFAQSKRSMPPEADPASATRTTAILVGAAGRPLWYGEESHEWLAGFFPERACDCARLPEPLRSWLGGRGREAVSSRSIRAPVHPLVRERDGRRLRLRLIPGMSADTRLLVLGLEPLPGSISMRRSGGLTQREIDVLRQVGYGKSNAEVAAALGISRFTVRCHLEHIFDKLRVASRTGAVTCFQQLCGSPRDPLGECGRGSSRLAAARWLASGRTAAPAGAPKNHNPPSSREHLAGRPPWRR
jgi:DNA-binding CsgD family transcriptional regulator